MEYTFYIAAPVVWLGFVTKTVDTTDILSINEQCLHSVVAVSLSHSAPFPPVSRMGVSKKSAPLPNPNWP